MSPNSALRLSALGHGSASVSASANSSSKGKGKGKTTAALCAAALRVTLLQQSPEDRSRWSERALGNPHSEEFRQMHQLLRDNFQRLTALQLHTILNVALNTYDRAQILVPRWPSRPSTSPEWPR